jgi:integrase
MSKLPPYVCEDTDRHGNVRTYLRKPGQPKVRLYGMTGTTAFRDQYEAALGNAKKADGKGVTKLHSWRWLCQQYMASPEFRALTGSTPNSRRLNLQWTWDKPFDPKKPNLLFGDCPIAHITAKKIRHIRNLKAGDALEKRPAANFLRKIIGYVFAWGLEHHDDVVTSNPIRDVAVLEYETDGHTPWLQEDFDQFMSVYPEGSKERRAMALFFYTGARGCDARLFGPQHVKNGRFVFNQHKTGGWVNLPVMNELAKELALAPRGDLAFILTEYGKTFSETGFGQWFNEKARKAGLVDRTAHGIRKGAATIAAENGATIHQLMAVFGWITEQMAIHYTKKANRMTLADAGMEHVKLKRNAINT